MYSHLGYHNFMKSSFYYRSVKYRVLDQHFQRRWFERISVGYRYEVSVYTHLIIVRVTIKLRLYRILCSRVDGTLAAQCSVVTGHVDLNRSKFLDVTLYSQCPVVVADDERIFRVVMGVAKFTCVDYLCRRFLKIIHYD